MRPYGINSKNCPQVLSQLQSLVADERSRLAPKKKFAFRSRNGAASAQPGVAANGEPAAIVNANDIGRSAAAVKDRDHSANVDEAFAPFSVPHGQLHSERDAKVVVYESIHGQKGEVRVISQAEHNGGDVTIHKCSDVHFVVRGKIRALRVLECMDLTVIAGPVAGSVFVDKVGASALALACRQV
jgi:hypothetical protein